MGKKFPIVPSHPERICWGCDRYCPADAMQCGNGSVRSMHPSELFGDDWQHWGLDAQTDPPSRPLQQPLVQPEPSPQSASTPMQTTNARGRACT